MTVVRPAIEARQLAKRYGATDALAPLDLVIPQGAIFALVGHNGAGKTTLIKLLLNIIQPTSGSATILGEPATKLKGAAFRRIGYVSENQEMPAWMTVQGLMDYLRPFYPSWNEASLLAELDLPPHQQIKHLSRGMRMKTALASVLAFHPPLILMDEPFSGLDPLVRDELITTLLDRMNSDSDSDDLGTTILISSHDLAEVELFATHVAFLHQGKLLFAESMTTLTARFREVTVTLASTNAAASAASELPPDWLLPESTASVLHFVHSNAAAISVEAQVRALLPNATFVESVPMSLRTIFLALVKSSRTQDRSRR